MKRDKEEAGLEGDEKEVKRARRGPGRGLMLALCAAMRGLGGSYPGCSSNICP